MNEINDKKILLIYTGGTFGEIISENETIIKKGFLLSYLYINKIFCDKDEIIN
jgi:hypothetical protein